MGHTSFRRAFFRWAALPSTLFQAASRCCDWRRSSCASRVVRGVSGFAADEIRAASVDTPQRSDDYRVERLAFSVVNY